MTMNELEEVMTEFMATFAATGPIGARSQLGFH